jgi:hypothetical protein
MYVKKALHHQLPQQECKFDVEVNPHEDMVEMDTSICSSYWFQSTFEQ